MAFDGSLFKLYNASSTKTDKYENFPLEYIYKESYSVTPNRRQDMDSTRNANGVLVRNVLDHTASTISVKTPPMDNTKLSTMMKFIKDRYSIEREKKLKIKYYCPDLDSYKEGEFYIPDIEFPIIKVDVDNKKILYNSVTLEFIEY